MLVQNGGKIFQVEVEARKVIVSDTIIRHDVHCKGRASEWSTIKVRPQDVFFKGRQIEFQLRTACIRKYTTPGSQMAWKKMLGGLGNREKGRTVGEAWGWAGRGVGSWTFVVPSSPTFHVGKGWPRKGCTKSYPDLSPLVVRCLCLRCPATDANYSFITVLRSS